MTVSGLEKLYVHLLVHEGAQTDLCRAQLYTVSV